MISRSALRHGARYFGVIRSAQELSRLRQFFIQNGYAVIPNVMNSAEVETVKREMESITKRQDQSKVMRAIFSAKYGQSRHDEDYFLSSGDKISYFFESDAFNEKDELKQPFHRSLNKVGHALHELNHVFEKFTYADTFKELASKVLGFTEPTIVQSMYIFKNPKIGGEVKPHTDNTYLRTNPLSCCGMWIALDDASQDNGALWGVPGSHLNPTKDFLVRKGQECFYHPEEKKDYDISSSVPLEAKAGTVVLLHGDFVHYSAHNTSNMQRHAYTFHIVEGKLKWEEDNWLQRGPQLPFRNMLSVDTSKRDPKYATATAEFEQQNFI